MNKFVCKYCKKEYIKELSLENHLCKKKKAILLKTDSNKISVCEFCNKGFFNEVLFLNHSCEKKNRWLKRNDLESKTALLAWNRFHELTTISRPTFTYREFINSKFYVAIMKFVRYMKGLNVLEPSKFIDYVIINGIPIDKWINDKVYEQFIFELVKTESPDKALERNIGLMAEWSNSTGEPWYDFFRKVNTNQAIQWIKNGRLSPWVVYNVDSAVNFFARCNEEQLNMITKYAAPNQWKLKFNKNQDDCNYIRTTLKNSGM